jgi:hypothetical protein
LLAIMQAEQLVRCYHHLKIMKSFFVWQHRLSCVIYMPGVTRCLVGRFMRIGHAIAK